MDSFVQPTNDKKLSARFVAPYGSSIDVAFEKQIVKDDPSSNL